MSVQLSACTSSTASPAAAAVRFQSLLEAASDVVLSTITMIASIELTASKVGSDVIQEVALVGYHILYSTEIRWNCVCWVWIESMEIGRQLFWMIYKPYMNLSCHLFYFKHTVKPNYVDFFYIWWPWSLTYWPLADRDGYSCNGEPVNQTWTFNDFHSWIRATGTEQADELTDREGITP